MSVVDVDPSVSTAIAFDEPGPATRTQGPDALVRLISSDLPDAE